MEGATFLLGWRLVVTQLVSLRLLLLGAVSLLWHPVHVDGVPIQLYGLNYNTRKGPDFYADVDKCKSRAEILTELLLLRRITSRIRLLSLTDCGQAELVLDILRNELSTDPMQLWLGLWVGSETWVFEEEFGELAGLVQRGLLTTDTVLGITVGSEAIYREDATETQVIEHVNRVRTLLSQSSTDPSLSELPITAVDIAPNYNVLPNLRAAVDVIMTNTFPFWEGIPIEVAVLDLQQDISYLRSLPDAVNKPFVLGETGWPSDGFIPGVGIASPENQLYFFRDFYCNVHVQQGLQYYWFTGIDNDWRQIQDPDNTIEGNWGIFDSDLQLKPHFQDFRFTCPGDGIEYSFDEIDWTVDRYTPAPAPLDPSSCRAHAQCATLSGNCCPNDADMFLACCGSITSPSPPTRAPIAPTNTPVSSPTTRTPTNVPTLVPNPSPTIFPTTTAPNPLPTGAPTTMVPSVSPLTSVPIQLPTTGQPSTVRPTTESPSKSPSRSPITNVPTAIPTTNAPTIHPTIPMSRTTVRPTASPIFSSSATRAPVGLIVETSVPTHNVDSVDSQDSPSPTLSPAPFLSSVVSRQETPLPTKPPQHPVLIDNIGAAASRSGGVGRSCYVTVTLIVWWGGGFMFGWL